MKGRTIGVSIKSTLKLSGSLSLKRTKEYYEKNKVMHVIVLVIMAGSPFAGLVFAGIYGVVIGLIFGILSYFLGPKAIVKVREISHR